MRHYQIAALLYKLSVKITPSQQVSLHLADALLFSGQLSRARLAYSVAEEGTDRKQALEASLKGLVCQSLVNTLGPEVSCAPHASDEIFARLEGEATEAVLEVDPLNPTANFNAGVSNVKAGEYDAAVVNFLVTAFRATGDSEAWSNALICASNLQDAHLGTAILECALYLGGEGAVQGFREQYLESAGAENTAKLDALTYELATKYPTQSLVLRVKMSNGEYEEVVRK